MIDPQTIPKAELHVHIEGTFEPGQIFEIAARNNVALKYPSVEALQAAYRFTDLQSFLDLYYAAMDVLRTERDFEDLTRAYLKRAASQGVKHAEIFFDPQAHMARGVRFETVIDGLTSALATSVRDFGMTTALIMCFLRDMSAESAMQTFETALPFAGRFIGVGLDSAEVGNPPSKFADVYARARAEGLHVVAHAGEEGPPEYIREALDILQVQRIDHGVRILEDPALVEWVAGEEIPLTVCPLSNVRLCVVPSLQAHPLKRMLDAGLMCTVNSDDPAYFGGYCGDNMTQTATALGLTEADVVTLARNSFAASFLPAHEKHRYLAQISELTQGRLLS